MFRCEAEVSVYASHRHTFSKPMLKDAKDRLSQTRCRGYHCLHLNSFKSRVRMVAIDYKMVFLNILYSTQCILSACM